MTGFRYVMGRRRRGLGVGGADGRRGRRSRQARRCRPGPAPRRRPPAANRTSEVHGGRLDRGAGGDELVLGRHQNGAAGEVGDDPPVGGAPGRAADEEHRARRVARPSGVGAGEQVAHHALDRGAGELGRRHVGAQPGRACRSRRAGSASARRRGAARAPGRPRRRAPPAPASSNRAWSTPSSRATASVTFVAFMVQTSGR